MLISKIGFFPWMEVVCNIVGTSYLVYGRILIKKKERVEHRKAMLRSFICSGGFLVAYLIQHSLFGDEHFVGEGAIRIVYFIILLTHIPMAALVPVLAIKLIWDGIKGNEEEHKLLARWVWPIWMYTNITGVLIFIFLYILY